MNGTDGLEGFDWEKAKKIGKLIILLAVVIALIFLLKNCFGDFWSSFWGGNEEQQVRINVPDDCRVINKTNGDKDVVCEKSQLTEEDVRRIVKEAICNNNCEENQPPPPPPPSPVKKDKCEDLGAPWECKDTLLWKPQPGKIKDDLCNGGPTIKCMIPGDRILCDDLGAPWECKDIRSFTPQKGKIRDGLCNGGEYIKCMIPGGDRTELTCSDFGPEWQCLDPKVNSARLGMIKRGYCPGNLLCMVPQENLTPQREPLKIICPDRQCTEWFVGSLLRYRGVRLVSRGAKLDPSSGHVWYTGSELVFDLPAKARLDYVNAKDANGTWSVSHSGSKINNGRETCQPDFPVAVERAGKRFNLTAAQAVKNNDWSYRVEEIYTLTNGMAPKTSDGSYNFSD